MVKDGEDSKAPSCCSADALVNASNLTKEGLVTVEDGREEIAGGSRGSGGRLEVVIAVFIFYIYIRSSFRKIGSSSVVNS